MRQRNRLGDVSVRPSHLDSGWVRAEPGGPSQQDAQAKGRRRSSAEVSELVAQYSAGGPAQEEFSRRHGLSLNTPVRRLSLMRRSTEPIAPASRWVAVKVAPDGRAEGSAASGVVLAVASQRVELGRKFDGETLRQLLMMLAWH